MVAKHILAFYKNIDDLGRAGDYLAVIEDISLKYGFDGLVDLQKLFDSEGMGT